MKCLSEVDAGRNLYLQDAITSEMLISKFNIFTIFLIFLNYFNILIIIKNLNKKNSEMLISITLPSTPYINSMTSYLYYEYEVKVPIPKYKTIPRNHKILISSPE